jgi:hypothetical protein
MFAHVSFENLGGLYRNMDKGLTARQATRAITYTLDQDMHTIVKTKGSQSTIKADFSYNQQDFSYNGMTWQAIKPDVEQLIKNFGISTIKDPYSVPV